MVAFIRLELTTELYSAMIQAIKQLRLYSVITLRKCTVCMQIKLDILIYSTLYKELGDSCILRDMLYSIYCFICADVKPTGAFFL